MEWNTNNLVVNGMISVVSTNVLNAPKLANVLRASDRNVQFSIEGSAGQNFRVWAATNLVSAPWVLLTNAAFGAEPALFVDATATNYFQRFYRVTIP